MSTFRVGEWSLKNHGSRKNFRPISWFAQSSFFQSSYVRHVVSIFFFLFLFRQNCFGVLIFSKANLFDLFVCLFNFRRLNCYSLNVSRAHLKHLQVSVSNSKSRYVLSSQRKTQVLPTHKVLHLPFTSPAIDRHESLVFLKDRISIEEVKNNCNN